MGVSGAEKAPGGLREPYLGIWRATVREMRRVGLWQPVLRSLLVEYIDALRWSERLRELASTGGRDVAATVDLAVQVDRASRRVLLFADRLGLTPNAQRRLGVAAVQAPSPPAGSVVAVLDEHRRRREATNGGTE